MNTLVKYEAACRALEEAHSVDEVKDIHDKAIAMRAYAIQAKNVDLEVMAAEVRARAERCLGEMLKAETDAGRLRKGRRWKSNGVSDTPLDSKKERVTLDEIGVDKNLSKRSQKIASISEQAFEAMVAGMRQQIKERSQKPPKGSTAEKKQRRAEREAELADKQRALPDKKYGVIVADPEWRFEPYSRDTGMDRAADNHYPTSPTDDICARDTLSIAAPDCVLFLWATAPMLPDAIKVMGAWGFTYKTHMIWHKLRSGRGRGSGYWVTGEHELLLIGSRGHVPAPATAMCGSVIAEPVGEHSAKPELFLEIIEANFPNLPKIELNRRGPARTGWDAWGLECDDGSSPDAHSPDNQSASVTTAVESVETPAGLSSPQEAHP